MSGSISGRYLSLLERSALIRLMIEREHRSINPSAVRLIRLKRLDLELSNQLRGFTERKLAQMASAPRFTPRLAFSRPGAASL